MGKQGLKFDRSAKPTPEAWVSHDHRTMGYVRAHEDRVTATFQVEPRGAMYEAAEAAGILSPEDHVEHMRIRLRRAYTATLRLRDGDWDWGPADRCFISGFGLALTWDDQGRPSRHLDDARALNHSAIWYELGCRFGALMRWIVSQAGENPCALEAQKRGEICVCDECVKGNG